MRRTKAVLNWEGSGTVQSLASVLEQQGAVALSLAPDLHHSLFVHLYPGASPGEPEQIDLSGDADLVARVAEISGLEALAELLPALRRAHAEVRVESPAPIIHIQIPASSSFGTRS
jgi:hypothetical protein